MPALNISISCLRGMGYRVLRARTSTAVQAYSYRTAYLISPSTYRYILDNLIPRTGHLSPVISVKLATVQALFPYDSTKCFATSVSIPYICINGKCNVGLHPSAPINFNSFVLHLPAFIRKWLTVASIVSSAICRYVVHFPPAIVTRPETGVMLVRWDRTRDSVFLAWGSRTR